MSAGDRFRDWIESAAVSWKDRLAGWMVDWFSRGVTRFIEAIEPEGLDFVDDSLERLLDNDLVPDNIRTLIDKIRAGGKPIPLLLAIPIGILLVLPIISGFFQPLGRVMSYLGERVFKSGRIDASIAVRGYFRGIIPEDRLRDTLRDYGLDEGDIDHFIEVSKFYPAPADLVRWQAREVFEPAMISKYGLDDEFGNIDLEPFRKAGMTDDQTLNYWRAHWEHASWNQIVEMLHRGLLEESDVWDWFRLVEIPPFWRDKLIASAYNIPTRVDVRRFYDLRTIDDARLREIYSAMGYHGKDLDDYILWTKIYVELPDLISRWKNGWITLDDARARLVELGMAAAAAEELVQTKVKVEESEAVQESKALTKTEIYKAVKQGRLTRDQGVDLLQDLEYSRDKAELLLDINVPENETDAAAGMRQLTKTDVKAALRDGIITGAEARGKLAGLGYSEANVELLISIFNAANNPPEEESSRRLSKTDIIQGVKKGVISAVEGYSMLQDIGFSAGDAAFILEVKAEESPFSPANFADFKSITQKIRISAGLEGKPVSEKLKELGDQLARQTAVVGQLRREVKAEEGRLTDDRVHPAAAEEKLQQLRAELYKQQAELDRIQTDYNAAVLDWKAGRG